MRLWFLLMAGVLAYQAQAAESFTNALGMSFIKVPAGEFMMGSKDLDAVLLELPDGDVESVRDETPAHTVVFPRGFYLGKTEVTRAQWTRLMDTRPGPESEWQREDWQRLPVVSVSWYDVQKFIEALNRHDSDVTYRLPTEAEWEYAARAGSQGLRPVSVEQLGDHAWYIDSSGYELHPVATRIANPWGLYDMYGNVWEWLQDWYAPGQYGVSETVNPRGPARGKKKIRRGGSYHCPLHLVRPAYRSADNPDVRYSVVGFRLVAEPAP